MTDENLFPKLNCGGDNNVKFCIECYYQTLHKADDATEAVYLAVINYESMICLQGKQ